MNRYAIVKDGVVINVTIVDGEIPDFLHAEGSLIPDPDELSGPGMLWNGTEFVTPDAE